MDDRSYMTFPQPIHLGLFFIVEQFLMTRKFSPPNRRLRNRLQQTSDGHSRKQHGRVRPTNSSFNSPSLSYPQSIVEMTCGSNPETILPNSSASSFALPDSNGCM